MEHTNNINFYKAERGLWSWLTTVDHKRIGLMYLGGLCLAFLIGGLLAITLRLELFNAAEDFVSADFYNQLYTLHGVIMVFAFIVPAIPGSFGNFFLPIQIGAPDMAFPKLNLLSFYLWLIGFIMVIICVLVGGIDGGWTFYAPYSISENPGVIWATSAAFILGFSSILTGLNFVVTVHKMRAQGLTWIRMPLFSFALYCTAIVQVVATPVIGVTLLLLILENVMHIGIFDPALGGDPVLFEHFFWFYSHPAVYIMVLPAFGVVSGVIPTLCRRTIFGRKAIMISTMLIALIGFLVWGHHMFVSGQSLVISTTFAFLTFFVGVPTAIKVFNWIMTIYKGSIELKAPMLYSIFFLILFSIGGFTGIILAILSLDIHLHDTYYVVAHFHYTMMGGGVFGFLAGLHYFWPKMTGRMYNHYASAIASILAFIGFNMVFIPQFVMGSLGMPRRYHVYIPDYEIYHRISTIGALLVGASLVFTLIYLLASLRKNGTKAEKNPWGGTTLEWTNTESPPVQFNFTKPPIVTEMPYMYDAEEK